MRQIRSQLAGLTVLLAVVLAVYACGHKSPEQIALETLSTTDQFYMLVKGEAEQDRHDKVITESQYQTVRNVLLEVKAGRQTLYIALSAYLSIEAPTRDAATLMDDVHLLTDTVAKLKTVWEKK